MNCVFLPTLMVVNQTLQSLVSSCLPTNHSSHQWNTCTFTGLPEKFPVDIFERKVSSVKLIKMVILSDHLSVSVPVSISVSPQRISCTNNSPTLRVFVKQVHVDQYHAMQRHLGFCGVRNRGWMCLNLLGLLRDSVLRGDSFCGPYLLVNNVTQDTPKTLSLFSFDSVPPQDGSVWYWSIKRNSSTMVELSHNRAYVSPYFGEFSTHSFNIQSIYHSYLKIINPDSFKKLKKTLIV